jgi:hypothetical protein
MRSAVPLIVYFLTFGCSSEETPATEPLGVDSGSDTSSTVVDSAVVDSAAADSSSADVVEETETSPPVKAGIDLVDLPRPIDLTPDGRIAAIEDVGATVDLYFFDTASKKQTKKTSVGDPSGAFSTGISATLRVSAVHMPMKVEAGYWEEATGWHDLDKVYPLGCDANVGGAFDISGDGKVLVGLVWNGCSPAAFKWTEGGAMKVLQVLGKPFEGKDHPTNRATVVSDDGAIVAGFAENAPADRSPAIWNADGTGFLLDPSNHDDPGEILSIDAHGTTVAGTWWAGEGFVWTKAKGIVKLGKFPGSSDIEPTFPNAIAADGKLVFGGCGDAWLGTPHAFVWTAKDGMRSLADLATANGVTIPTGITLNNVVAASLDGSVLLGTCSDEMGKSQSFVLHLQPTAYGL